MVAGSSPVTSFQSTLESNGSGVFFLSCCLPKRIAALRFGKYLIFDTTYAIICVDAQNASKKLTEGIILKRNGRVTGIALSLLIGIGMLPMSSLTASATESGTCGNCTWEISDGVLTISPITGTDGMLAATTTESPWRAYSTSITSVEIAEGVVADAQSPYLFSNLKSATTMELANLDTSNVTNMEGMFSGCSSLEVVYAGTWDTGSVTDMSNLFRNCFSLRTLTVSRWDTANVEDMSYAFAGCSKSQTLVLTYWSTEAVKDIDCIFAGTSLLETLYIGGGWNITAAANNTNIFADTALTEIRYYGTCRQWVDNCAWYTYPENCTIKYRGGSSGISDHIDAIGDGDHICDLCAAARGSECTDVVSDGDHICDECGKVAGTCTDVGDDGDHFCDDCGATASTCSDTMGDGDHLCDDCGATLSSCADAADDNDHLCDDCDAALSSCSDATGDGDHRCDECRKVLSYCSDTTGDGDHLCDECGAKVNSCWDANSDGDHLCNECGKVLSTCYDTVYDGDHLCNDCGATLSSCSDATGDGDHYCDECPAVCTECADEDSDHTCDECRKVLSYCWEATGDDHFCDVCGDGNITPCIDMDDDYACDVCGMRDVIAVEYPESITAAVGETVTVDITTFGEVKYYWWFIWDRDYNSLYDEPTYGAFSFEMTEEYADGYLTCIITGMDENESYSEVCIPLKLASPVTITKQPVSVTVAKGITATVTVGATGDGLTYTWYYKNATMTSFVKTTTFTGDTYSIEMTALRSGRQIYCVVTDQYGNSVQSNTVTLTMS